MTPTERRQRAEQIAKDWEQTLSEFYLLAQGDPMVVFPVKRLTQSLDAVLAQVDTAAYQRGRRETREELKRGLCDTCLRRLQA